MCNSWAIPAFATQLIKDIKSERQFHAASMLIPHLFGLLEQEHGFLCSIEKLKRSSR